jgi:hypothetical protein
MANTVKETKYIKIKDSYYYSIPNGKSYYEMICPFCNSEIIVYAWSASSVGKKCENCKAKVIYNFRTGEFEVCKTKKEKEKKNKK